MNCDDPRDGYREPRRPRPPRRVRREEADYDRRPHDWDLEGEGDRVASRRDYDDGGPAYGRRGEYEAGPDGAGPADYDLGVDGRRQYRRGEPISGHRSGFYDRAPRRDDFAPPPSDQPGPDGMPKPEYTGPKNRKDWLIREWQTAHEQACHEVRVEFLKEKIRASWGASIEMIAGEVDRLMYKDWELCQQDGDQHEARQKLVAELSEKILEIYKKGPGARSAPKTKKKG